MIKKDEPMPTNRKKTDSLKAPKSSSKYATVCQKSFFNFLSLINALLTRRSRSDGESSSGSSLPLTSATVLSLQQEIEKLSLGISIFLVISFLRAFYLLLIF